jgi:peptide subunit release factor 1 (eRF1)
VGGAGAAKTNAVGVAKSSGVDVAKSTASPAKMKSKAGGNSNDEYRNTIAEGKSSLN